MHPRNKKKSSLDARLNFARKDNSSGSAEGTILDRKFAGKGKNSISKNTTSPPQTPEVEQAIPEGCICHREANTFVCIYCKMFCFGRICLHCPIHPNVSYLMDFSCCPYCSGPSEHLHVVNMEYERYFKP